MGLDEKRPYEQFQISELLNQIEEAESKQEWDKVIEAGETILKLDSSHEIAFQKTANGYLNRGSAYAGLRQYQRAIQDYDRAIQLNPNYAKAYYNRGLAYKELWHKEAARRS